MLLLWQRLILYKFNFQLYMKIYDCFMFFDEEMLLDLRLNILDKYVDKFVITEANYTHNGKPKKLVFDINNFKKFKDKIIHIVVDQDPVEQTLRNVTDLGTKRLNSIKRIEFQRNEILRGLSNASDEDYIIYSDNDEIPNLENINFLQNKSKIILFKQNMYYYKFNLAYPKLDWYGSKSCKKKKFEEYFLVKKYKNKKI